MSDAQGPVLVDVFRFENWCTDFEETFLLGSKHALGILSHLNGHTPFRKGITAAQERNFVPF